MKAFRILATLIVLVALFGFEMNNVHTVQAAFPFTYTSGFQVQNIDPNNDAIVTIDFYDSTTGAKVTGAEIKDTIAKATSTTYLTLTGLPSGFQGSVVISSSAQVASVVNINGIGAGGNAWASYVGAISGGSPVLIPLLMANNSGYNTWFSVQNTGGTATDVSVAYSDGKTNSKPGLQPGASWVFDQTTEGHTAKIFSATVTASGGGQLAATVIEENNSIMFAYNGFTAGSQTVAIPLINSNNAGYATGTQIMNTGGNQTTVTVSYIPSVAGTACTETQTIQGGASATFTLYAFSPGNPTPPGSSGYSTTCAGGARFVGSAIVSANSAGMNLVAISNQLKPGVNGEANNDFDPSTATSQVVLPLIMDRNSGWSTGFNIMNVGTTADINCTFTGTTHTVSQTGVAQYAALNNLQGNTIAYKYVGSATCTASAGGKLVAVVNELNLAPGANLMVYEGIPVGQ